LQVLKENAQDLEVMFIDYGNLLTVDRSEVFRPVSMKCWNQKPFGHLFQLDADVPIIACEKLTPLYVDKSVELQILKQDENIATCVFTDVCSATDSVQDSIESVVARAHVNSSFDTIIF
jgi:hypothetical protein